MLEGRVSLRPERDRHCHVLGARLVRFDGCSVVVKRLPLVRIPIPVETRGLNVHVEIISQLVDNPRESRTVLKFKTALQYYRLIRI